MGKGERQEKIYNQALHHTEMDLDKIDINAEPPIEEPVRQYYFIAKWSGWKGLNEKRVVVRAFLHRPLGVK